MSDLTLNRFLASGTNAERLAFTPDPPTPASGPDPTYIWVETDTGSAYGWDFDLADWIPIATPSVGLPGSSTDNAIARWNGAGGDVLQDSTPTVEDDGRIANVTDPSGAQNAATKAYVDAADALKVTGPGSATDNAIARYDGTTGKIAQNSTPTVEDDGRIANVTDPSGSSDAATKQYVDGLAANLGKRQRVRAATTGNVTISTALNNADTIDGVALVTGDLVLVKSQSAPEQNGVYVVGVSPARAVEFDTYDEYPGSLLAVAEGTLNADTIWLCTSNAGGTLNTTALVFSQITTGITVPEATVTGRPAGAGSGGRTDLSAAQVREIIALTTVIGAVFDGGGSVPTSRTVYVRVPYDYTITGWQIVADQAGSCVVDVWKDSYANFPPTIADTIAGSEKPTLSSAQKNQDVSLSTWTTSISAGDYLAFKLETGPATLTWVAVFLIGVRG